MEQIPPMDPTTTSTSTSNLSTTIPANANQPPTTSGDNTGDAIIPTNSTASSTSNQQQNPTTITAQDPSHVQDNTLTSPIVEPQAVSQNIDNVLGATEPPDRNKAQNQECPIEPTSTSSYHNQGLIDMRDDSKILDSRFPPLHVLQMMTKEEYTQYQKDFLRIEEETAKV
jgi:hypothetical protein